MRRAAPAGHVANRSAGRPRRRQPVDHPQPRARTFARALAMRHRWASPISSNVRHQVAGEATAPNTSAGGAARRCRRSPHPIGDHHRQVDQHPAAIMPR